MIFFDYYRCFCLLFFFIIMVYVYCVGGCTHTTAQCVRSCMWRSMDNLQKLVPTFCHMDSAAQIQIISSAFYHCCDKISDQSNLKKKFSFSSQFAGAGARGSCSHCMCNQEAVSREGPCSASSLLLRQPGTVEKF